MDRTGTPPPVPMTGAAAGVPYLAFPPAGGVRRAPLVVAWHGLDLPRSRQAMAAVLPLAGLPAWRVYLGLPMPGDRGPAGGRETVGLGAEELAGRLFGAMVEQAAAELPAVVEALRVQLQPAAGPIGLVGGSVGAAVALLILAEGRVPVQAAVLVRPAVQLQRVVAVNHRRRDRPSRWAESAGAVAGRLDVVARAHQIAARDPQPALLLVVGARDDAGIREPAERLWHTLAGRYHDPGRVGLLVVADLGHTLAEELDSHLAPRTAGAARVDAAVTGWLDRHLTSKEAS
jgi:dienelactone hydrolase